MAYIYYHEHIETSPLARDVGKFPLTQYSHL